MKAGRLAASAGAYALLGVFAVLAVFPLYFAAVSSLKANPDYLADRLGLPLRPTLDNFAAVARAGLPRYLLNSLVVVPAGLVLYMLVVVSAGFAFGMLRFRLRLAAFLAVLFLMIFPQMVLATQVYVMCLRLRLANNYFGLVLTWVAYFAPYGAYMMTTYFAGVPREVLESARMDGAGVWRILARVTAPMAAPMMAICGVIGFNSMWNELPFAMLLMQDQKLRTLMQGLAVMGGEYGLLDPIQAAALLVAAGPPILVYIAFQKHVTLGAFAGAVKG